MALQPFKKQKIEETKIENEESLFLNLFDAHLIQQIFTQLVNSNIFYEDYKSCLSDCNSFSSTSKLFNSVAKQIKFSIKIFQNEKIENINYSIYLTLCGILERDYEDSDDRGFDTKEELLDNMLLSNIAQEGIYNIIETLISNGANPNCEETIPYETLSPVLYSCDNGYYKTTKLLILNGANINSKTDEDLTLLHLACRFDNLKLIKYLLKQGLNPNSLADQETPLFCACEYGHLDIVKCLINNGCNVNIQNNKKQTVLFDACTYEDLDLVQLLVINGCDVTLKDHFKETALFYACNFGSMDTTKYLIEEKTLNTDDENGDERTILFEAILSKNIELVDYLLSLGTLFF